MLRSTAWIATCFVITSLFSGILPAADVSLNNDPDSTSGVGSGADGGGMIGGRIEFSTLISMTNANADDSAQFATVDNGIQAWIQDNSDNQSNWISQFDISFTEPINNLKLSSLSPTNNSDTVEWLVRWEGSAIAGNLQNSPALVGEYSLYAGDSRVSDGDFFSGTAFRLDDDDLPSGDSNGTPDGDLNIDSPSTPWTLALPDGITKVSIEASVAVGGDVVRGFEGFGVDFSDVVVVPEPRSSVLTIAGILLLLRCNRRCKK